MNRSPTDHRHAPATPVEAPDPAAASRSEAPEHTHRLQSHEVMRGQSAVAIEHNGQVYRLQTTRQGKLILTK